MKIGIFSDSHYCSAEIKCKTRRPNLSLDKIKEAYREFEKEQVDFVLCMGDMVDHCDTHEEAEGYLNNLLQVVKGSKLPFYFVPGNHDYYDFTVEEMESHGLSLPPYTMVINGIRLIALDANYRSDMRRFDVAGVEWTDSNLPPEQVAFLTQTLKDSQEPCIVLVHENLDNTVPENHIIKNADEIRKIIAESGRVRLVIQGHYHAGSDTVIDGIRYLTVSAMCEGEENHFMILEVEK